MQDKIRITGRVCRLDGISMGNTPQINKFIVNTVTRLRTSMRLSVDANKDFASHRGRIMAMANNLAQYLLAFARNKYIEKTNTQENAAPLRGFLLLSFCAQRYIDGMCLTSMD